MTKTAADAVRFAYSHLGDHEDPPGSNRTVFGEWYGDDGVYWCLIFASFVIVGQCGVSLPGAQKAGKGFESSVACLDAANQHGRNPGVHGLHGGDIVIYHVPGERSGPNHGGVFIRYCTEHTACVVSVDGNTGHSTTENQRDGGCVDEKHRPLSWVLGGYRPDYAKPAPALVAAHPSWWTKVTHVGQASQEVASALKVLANRDFPPQVTLDSHIAGLFRYIQSKRSIAVTGDLDAATANAIAHWAA